MLKRGAPGFINSGGMRGSRNLQCHEFDAAEFNFQAFRMKRFGNSRGINKYIISVILRYIFEETGYFASFAGGIRLVKEK